jgi:hypothetical protein
MKSFYIFTFVLISGIAACGGEQAQPETPASTTQPSGAGQQPTQPATQPTATQPTSSSTTPPGAQLQGAGQGPASPEVDRKSPDCKFVIPSGRCFVIQAAACAAAGCDQAKCISAESFPAQVSCKK